MKVQDSNSVETDTQSCQTAVKSRFFGQYFEQIVAKEIKYPNSPTINTTTVFLINGLSNYHLELKPLSQISDEEREFCVSIGNGRFYQNFQQNQVDYLRSKGYALPFMEYSVDDLVSFGWVQLL